MTRPLTASVFALLVAGAPLAQGAPADGALRMPDPLAGNVGTRCDAGIAMPAPFSTVPMYPPMPQLRLDGPGPVDMPNLCGEPYVVAPRRSSEVVVDSLGRARPLSLPIRPLPNGHGRLREDLDRLRQRYDVYDEFLNRPRPRQNLPPVAPPDNRP